MTSKTRKPSIFVAIAIIAFLVMMLFFTIKTFGVDSLGGGSQISLLLTSFLCIFIGTVFYKKPWDDYEEAIKESVGGVGSAVIILLVIGALGGAWMISGVVPTLIYYGLKILHPTIFLLATCILCSIVSLVIGSSWTTIATVGVALIGIGQAYDYNVALVAGAIISGAYFGDKMSPLSDTTVVASSSSGTPLFEHIKYMTITTIPSLLITLIIFTVIGFLHVDEGGVCPQELSVKLQERFLISPWLLLVPVFTGVLIAKKLPPIVTLFLSTIVAIVVAVIFQKNAIYEIAFHDELVKLVNETGKSSKEILEELCKNATFNDLFKGTTTTLFGSTALESDHDLLEELISTGGMGGMLHTVWLVICAMTFGACMKACGLVDVMTDYCRKLITKRGPLVGTTVATGFFLNVTTADQYLSIILTSNLFKEVYEKNGFENRLLSRSLEDGATVTSPLIPWSTCGMTHSTILGVSTFAYFPYCFFCYLSPIISVLIASIGYKIFKRNENGEFVPVRK